MNELVEKKTLFSSIKNNPPWFFATLLLISFITCVIAGTQWAFKDLHEIANWKYGISYAVLILTFLSSHEFGHYIAARIHKVDATLPFYIPFPFTFTLNFGTMGAVIKTRTMIPNRKALFDIGIAGPLSGFVVCIAFLIYGYSTLPGIDFIYNLHPEYVLHNGGQIPHTGLFFGKSIVIVFFEKIFAGTNGFMPPMNEIYHYPFLNVGWFGLFVTTLNMLPIGQLDGGHIIYAMFGKLHAKIARIMWWILIVIGIGASITVFYELFSIPYETAIINQITKILLIPFKFIKENFPYLTEGWFGWLAWALITKFFIKIDHPPVFDESKLNTGRMVLGIISIVVLMLSFSITGIYFIE